MAYGRQYMMDGLRKAGNAFLDMDERYAKALEDRLPSNPNVVQGFGGFGRAVPIREMNPFAAESRNDMLIDSAVLGANVASRYLLPAGGVTLAGKGLYDLTIGFGSEADETQPSQLALY